MLQTAAARTPRNANVLDVPALFVNPRMHTLVQLLAFSSAIAELWVGFSLFRWVGPGNLVAIHHRGQSVFPGKESGAASREESTRVRCRSTGSENRCFAMEFRAKKVSLLFVSARSEIPGRLGLRPLLSTCEPRADLAA